MKQTTNHEAKTNIAGKDSSGGKARRQGHRPQQGKDARPSAQGGAGAVAESQTPFRPHRRATRDGGARPISNGVNADDGEQMLSLVRDREHLEDATALQDGLANLMHWCHREGIDFDQCLAMARVHFEMEA